MRSLELALLLALAGCGRLGFESRASDGDAMRDGIGDAVGDVGDAFANTPFASPTPLVALNSMVDDSDPELRGDGLEIIFHSLRSGGRGGYDIYRAVRGSTDDAFFPPTPIVSVNTAADEGWPTLSNDGLTLYFSNGQDLFFATRTSVDAAFDAPQALPELSSADPDTTPEISRDGRLAMVTRGTTDSREIWVYTRAADGPAPSGWSTASRVAELGSPVTDASPDLDDQALVVYFHSNRAGSLDDLYVAIRVSPDEPFAAPALVGELSTSQDEGDPSTSADRRIIVFHRGLDLYMAVR